MYKFLKDKNALYIEDEDIIRENVTELIGDYFRAFHTANSGEEGFEKFIKENINVVIVDIELPKMSGIELLRKIRKLDKDVHLVIISAHTKTEYLLDSISFKLEQYIVKPLSSRKVRSLLKNLNDEFSKNSIIELTPTVLMDKEAGIVSFDGIEHTLTKKESKILSILAYKKISLMMR